MGHKEDEQAVAFKSTKMLSLAFLPLSRINMVFGESVAWQIIYLKELTNGQFE